MVGTVKAPLFVPANRPDRFAKAAATGTDAVILDLEDAVAPEDKDTARSNLACGFTDLPVVLRVNATGTRWHDQDLAAGRNMSLAAVMLPKSENSASVASVSDALNGLPLIALIETAEGLANARAIAAVPGVVRLAFGSVDFCADLGCAHQRDALLSARCELVLASRLASIAPPLDGVTVQLGDPDAAFSDARHARDLGMTGKLCIHPRQIAPVKQAFAPTQEDLSWARRVLASGEGATRVDGAMVDEPIRIKARRILQGT